MINKLFCKMNTINDLDHLTIKIGLILSIGYFIIAIICQSTINGSANVLQDVNNINNYVKIAMTNSIAFPILAYIFNLKIKKNNK